MRLKTLNTARAQEVSGLDMEATTVFRHNSFMTWVDHVMLWGGFFAFGLVFGFFMAYALIMSGGKRL